MVKCPQYLDLKPSGTFHRTRFEGRLLLHRKVPQVIPAYSARTLISILAIFR
jgi:hypothetical protein